MSSATATDVTPAVSKPSHSASGNSTKAEGADQEALALLREAVTPQLYQRNGFRVLELSVDATHRDIARRKQMMEMAAGNGLAAPAGPGRCFPLDPAPDAFHVRDAMQRLSDPERRFVDELFWFWPLAPGEGKSDEALQYLFQGNDRRAAELWSQQEADPSVGDVATHNLAVLDHLFALELEEQANQTALSREDEKRLQGHWENAFLRWLLLLDQDTFWTRLSARVHEFGDPRLTAATVRRLRAALPAALLSIIARLAISAAEQGNSDSALRRVTVIRNSGFTEEAVSEACRLAAGPVRARIKALGKAAAHTAETNAVQAGQACRELVDSAKPLLEALDCLLPPGDPTREVAHDEVAEQALSTQVAFSNKTSDWNQSAELLSRAVSLAASERVSKRLRENLETVRENAKETNWWCAPGYWACAPKVVSVLENARQLVESTKEDAAIEVICGLIRQCLAGAFDEAHKPVLERCLSWALNRKAVRLDKEAWATYNVDPPTLRRAWETLRSMSQHEIFNCIPELADSRSSYSPYGSSRLRCLFGHSIYSTYYRRKFGELSIAFCESCNGDMNREFREQERVRNAALEGLLELAMLALELNPKSKQLRANCDVFREQARKLSLPLPQNTVGLRRKLDILSLHTTHKNARTRREELLFMRILTAAIVVVCVVGGLIWTFSKDNQYQAHVGALDPAQETRSQITAQVENAAEQSIPPDQSASIEEAANKGGAIVVLPQPPDANQTNLEEIEKDAKSGVLEAQYKLGLMYQYLRHQSGSLCVDSADFGGLENPVIG